MMTTCFACEGTRFRQIRLGGPWSLSECAYCGSAQLDPLPTEDQLREAYSSSYYGADGSKFLRPLEKVMQGLAEREAAVLVSELGANSTILDIGCGRGLVAGALSHRGITSIGVERSESAARGLDPRVKLIIDPEITLQDVPVGSCDAVIFRHVLEHLRSPREVLERARERLSPRGTIFIEVPDWRSPQAQLFRANWFHLDPPRHLWHFTCEGLEALLKAAGLRGKPYTSISLAQDAMGWLQSGLHAVGRPRNAFFDGLRHGSAKPGLRDFALAAALAGPALAATACGTAAGRGSVLRVSAVPQI